MDKYFTTDAYYKIEIQRTRAFSIYMGLVPPPSIFAQAETCNIWDITIP